MIIRPVVSGVIRPPVRGYALNKGGGFSLAAFMAAQSDGFWYDFGQTDRLFQEPNGPTPADEPNEVIGLALSSRLWGGKSLAAYLAEQPELVTNGDFANGLTGFSNLSTGTGSASVSSGQLTITRVDASNVGWVNQAISVTSGRVYRVAVERVSGSGAAIRVGTTSGGSDLYDAVAGAGVTAIFVTATSGTLNVNLRGATNGSTTVFDNVSVKEVSRYAATQATGTLKPKYQTTGAAFDGSDDNLLTGYLAGAAENFIVAKVSVPITLSALSIFAGSQDTNRFYAGFDSSGGSAGKFVARVGGTTGYGGGPDCRGSEVVVGFSNDGTTVRAFSGGEIVAEGAQSGGVPTVPLRIGANNGNGTAASFFGGSIKSIVAGRQFLDLSTFNKIAAAL